MVITILKTAFAKLVPKRVIYRDYKNFNRGKFKRELKGKINENFNLIDKYDLFWKTFLLVLHKYAQIKTNILRTPHVLYMTKILREAVIKRTELETRYLKNKTGINLKEYKKEFCSKL